jgi:hypothetical protein
MLLVFINIKMQALVIHKTIIDNNNRFNNKKFICSNNNYESKRYINYLDDIVTIIIQLFMLFAILHLLDVLLFHDVYSKYIYFIVTIWKPSIKKKTGTKRKNGNRRMPCKYCQVFVHNISRHLRRLHSEEVDVAAASAKIGRQKTLAFGKIQNEGIFNNNIKVIKTKEGLFLPARASQKEHSSNDYVPCAFCLLFFLRDELWRHSATCAHRAENDTSENCTAAGMTILKSALTERIDESDLEKLVLSKMRRDKVSAEAGKDNIIIRYGTLQLQKLGPRRSNDISQRLRMLARLRICLQKSMKVPNLQLEDIITGKHFDAVIAAVEAEGGSFLNNNGRRCYNNPTVALKLGNMLIKLAQIKKGAAVRDGNRAAREDAETFISLHQNEFTDTVSSLALASLKSRENKLLSLPTNTDLQILKSFLVSSMDQLSKQLNHSQQDSTLWRKLAEVVLTRAVIFNARRGSEVAELLYADYERRARYSVTDADIQGMDEVEQCLAKRYVLKQTIKYSCFKKFCNWIT